MYFTQKIFNPDDFWRSISRNPSCLQNVRVTNDIFIPHYSADRELRPLLPLTKDMSYICAVQGQGKGSVAVKETRTSISSARQREGQQESVAPG